MSEPSQPPMQHILGADREMLLAFFLSKAWALYVEQHGKPPDGSREQFYEMMGLEPWIREYLYYHTTPKPRS
jgi:hypothetical protein